MWEAYPLQMPLFTELRKVVKYFKQFGLAKAIETKLEETRWRKHLDCWQPIIYSYTTNEATKANTKNIRTQLQNLVD